MDTQSLRVLELFEEISRIPRCSGNEDAAARWFEAWAAARGWKTERDRTGNLRIDVPATAGSERAPGVVIQGHLDMVCEKTPESGHDFTRDPIRVVRDGEWVPRRRDHPRGGQRRGARARGGGGRGPRPAAPPPGAPVHRRRGERPHRGEAAGPRFPHRPHPDQPGFRNRGRVHRRVRRRQGSGSAPRPAHEPMPGRLADAGAQGGGAARGAFRNRHPPPEGQRHQAARAHPERPARARRPATGDTHRRQPSQCHPTGGRRPDRLRPRTGGRGEAPDGRHSRSDSGPNTPPKPN